MERSQGTPRVNSQKEKPGRGEGAFFSESQRQHGPADILVSDFWPPCDGSHRWKHPRPTSPSVTLTSDNSAPVTWAPFGSSNAPGIAPPPGPLHLLPHPRLESSPPRFLHGSSLTSSRSLLKSHLLQEALFDDPPLLTPFPALSLPLALHPFYALFISPDHCLPPQLGCQFHKEQGQRFVWSLLCSLAQCQACKYYSISVC